MGDSDDLRREIALLRERISRLSAASLRISASLDVDTVLREGEVESFVITMQDLAPREALERSRTEVLSLVSHELRSPLTSIKGASAPGGIFLQEGRH